MTASRPVPIKYWQIDQETLGLIVESGPPASTSCEVVKTDETTDEGFAFVPNVELLCSGAEPELRIGTSSGSRSDPSPLVVAACWTDWANPGPCARHRANSLRWVRHVTLGVAD